MSKETSTDDAGAYAKAARSIDSMCVKGRDLLERIADAKDELKLAKVEEQKAWDAWQAEASAKLSETLSEKASEARSEVKQLEQLIADAKVEFATLHAAYLEAVKGIV